MKILHVIRDLSRATGGPVNALKGLAEAQLEIGHTVTVVAGHVAGEVVEPLGVDLELVRLRDNRWSWAPDFSSTLDKAIRECDIVHAHLVWDFPVWEAARLARKHSKPFILRPCGNLEAWSLKQSGVRKKIYLKFFGAVIEFASRIHFTSQHELVESEAITGNGRGIVIPLGILPQWFERPSGLNTFAEIYPETAGRCLVLFLGRLHPKKQPEIAIEAFAKAAVQDDRLHLVLGGPCEASYLAQLQALVQTAGVTDRVTFTGLLDDLDAWRAFSASSMFILPSLQENFGIAVVEAMATKCPVVISDKVGISDEVAEADAGIICPLDASAFALAINRLASDSSLRRRIGENGYHLAFSRYRWPAVARRVIEMYDSVLS